MEMESPTKFSAQPHPKHYLLWENIDTWSSNILLTVFIKGLYNQKRKNKKVNYLYGMGWNSILKGVSLKTYCPTKKRTHILSNKPITPQLPQSTLGKIKNKLPGSLERILVWHCKKTFKKSKLKKKNIYFEIAWKLAGRKAVSRFWPQMKLEHAGKSVWIGDN